MELFIKVYFWIAAVGFVIRLLGLGFASYPREVSKGCDAVSAIISIPFLLWSAILLWGITN
jgi:hypothetical protein